MTVTINSFSDIPGWTSVNQLKNFKKIAELLPSNPRVLEIGCGYGRSTWAWLDALSPDTHYAILDEFSMKTDQIFPSNSKNFINEHGASSKVVKRFGSSNLSHYEIFRTVIDQHKNKKIIKQIWDIDSEIWIRDFKTTDWDLVYIDEVHTYESTYNWLELFKDIKYVCGDDYVDTWPGLVDAVNQYARKYSRQLTASMDDRFFLIKNF